jgi:hypothetical protein
MLIETMKKNNYSILCDDRKKYKWNYLLKVVENNILSFKIKIRITELHMGLHMGLILTILSYNFCG